MRKEINEVFERRGLIVFEGVEASTDMHLAISNVFGPLKDHPVPVVARVDQKKAPGVIDMKYDPADGGVVEIEGKPLAQWLPWHFDHCYNNELNRAGVLRAVTIPPEGGRTGFADGIELYKSLSEETQRKIEGQHVIYTLDLLYAHMRFGVPKGFRELRVNESAYASSAYAKNLPRAIHPAVWQRKSGEKVLHVSPWMAVGIRDHEDTRRRLAARSGVPGDDRQDSSVLPFLEAGPHGDLGQLAHAALRERYGPEVREADAAHDDRRRLWPRILREGWQGR